MKLKPHRSHPCQALLEAVVRFWGSGLSSSGVERTFHLQRKRGALHLSGTDDSAVDDATEMYEIVALNAVEQNDICENAVNLWKLHYGAPRLSGVARRPRSDKGVHKRAATSASSDKPSEASWIKKRRLDVHHEASKAGMNAGISADEDMWTASHSKELDFVANKYANRLLDQVLNGDRLPDGLPDETISYLNTVMDTRVKRDQQYTRRMQNQRQSQQRPRPVVMEGRYMFLCSDIDSDALRKSLLQQNRIVECAQHADTIVVSDLTCIPINAEFAACLVGGCVCTVPFAMSCDGASHVYRPALASRRLIFFTDAFLTETPELSVLIMDMCARFTGRCSWRFTHDELYFLQRALREPTVAVAFIAASDKAKPVWRSMKQAFVAQEALRFFRRLDMAQCTSGVCGW